VEGVRRKWIDLSLKESGSVSTDNTEPRPTKPRGGKPSLSLNVESDEHISESRVENPSSR